MENDASLRGAKASITPHPGERICVPSTERPEWTRQGREAGEKVMEDLSKHVPCNSTSRERPREAPLLSLQPKLTLSAVAHLTSCQTQERGT